MDDRRRTRWAVEAQGRADTYDDRWVDLAAQGLDLHGEADFVESLGRAPVLDAGCGTGRVAAELARRGIEVVGVDLDPAMLARARAKAPDVPWVEADLAELDLGRRFGAAVMAGNVMIYLQPGSEAAVVARVAAHLEPGGLLVAGFQLEPGRLELTSYDRYALAAGLELRERWATWDRQPYEPGPGEEHGGFAVSVHERIT